MIDRKNKIKFLPENYKISGLAIKTFKAGIKKKTKEDLSLVVFNELANISFVLTKSKTFAANIKWLKSIKKHGKAKVLFVNSENANAFTGKIGYENVKRIALAAANKFYCKKEEVIISSTGVIGEQLPIDKIINIFNQFEEKKSFSSQNWSSFAQSIMTTDTFPKIYWKNSVFNKKKIKILGVAKGSGMIAPNMATMLAFIFTDAKIPHSLLNKIIKEIVDKSFNNITVDSDMSTSDMFCLIATNKVNCGELRDINDSNIERLKTDLEEVAIELAKMIVVDGEGAKKLIEINVSGVYKDTDAKLIAMSIANSPLVKTAIAGEDANWGRIIMAIGKTKAKIKQEEISLKIGRYSIVKNGEVIKNYKEINISHYLKGSKINLFINLGKGKYSSRVWTCDLTKKYIEINAEYRS